MSLASELRVGPLAAYPVTSLATSRHDTPMLENVMLTLMNDNRNSNTVTNIPVVDYYDYLCLHRARGLSSLLSRCSIPPTES